MSGEVKTQGTELYFAAGSPISVMKMTCPTGITGLGGARDQIDSTCLSAKTDKSSVAGLGNPGQVSVPFILKPSETDQQQLFDLKASGIDVNWVIGLSDGTDAPTLDSDDALTPPAASARTSAKFVAYVADVNIDIATNEIVRGTMVLQRSGAVTWTWKAA